MAQKFSTEERAKFLKDLESVGLQSDSELQDSFYQTQRKRMQAQITSLRTQQDWSILEQLKKTVKEEDELIQDYQKEREELHQITSNEAKNVIDHKLIQNIKQKIANNQSILTLADQQYNQSLLAQSAVPQQTKTSNQSFLKTKNLQQKIKAQEAIILKKIQLASQQRQQLAMEQEDKWSYKQEMQYLSNLFQERFLRPKFQPMKEKDTTIQLVFTKLPPSFVRLVPQQISEETVLPKNAPEIALKQLKQTKRKNLKPSGTVDVKINPKKLQKQNQCFQEVNRNNPQSKSLSNPVDLMLRQYLKKVKPLVGQIQKIATQYHPRFLRYLKQEQKNLNYETQQKLGNQKNITHVTSLQNSNSLCQLKLSFEKLTNLKGIEQFKNLQEAQLQFNLLVSVDPLQICTKLIQLNLSHNKIKNINFLNHLSWLRLLNIQHNLVQQLKPDCKTLEALFASNNRIEILDLDKTPQLRLLQLQYNRLQSLPTLKLLGLEELLLSHNQLTDITGIEQLVLLKKLDLQHNRISVIEKLSFLYLNSLNLANNGLSTLKDLFLPCLQQLCISSNRLVSKGSGIAFLPNLKEVNIDDNRLEGFGCVWWLLRFSRGAQIIRYGNNQYFLSLREKVRQVYESLLYKSFPTLKILNDAPSDRGLAQYYRQNYSIYFDGSTFFAQSGPSLKKIQTIIRLLLRQSTFSRTLQTKLDPFSREQAYIDYQWKCKVASLKQVIELTQHNQKLLIVPPTLFHRYDSHQVSRRNLYHLLRGLVLSKKMRLKRKNKYYLKLRPTIIKLLQMLYSQHIKSQKLKSIGKFSMILRGMNEAQAAIKIQKIWRGYIRRRIYKKIKKVKPSGKDQDLDDVDTDFFNKQLQKIQFDVDLEGFEDIIIRPEVFELLQQKQEEKAAKPIKQKKQSKNQQEKAPMLNNFLNSRSKLTKPNVPQKSNEQTEAQRVMRQWKIKDPRVLKALQFKQQKRQEMKKKQEQKNMNADERLERFRRGN